MKVLTNGDDCMQMVIHKNVDSVMDFNSYAAYITAVRKKCQIKGSIWDEEQPVLPDLVSVNKEKKSLMLRL